MASKTREKVKRRKEKIYLEQKGCCHYCNSLMTLEVATFDHKKAVSKGGKSGKDNLVLACIPCNQLKANFSSLDEVLEHTRKLISFWERIEKNNLLKL